MKIIGLAGGIGCGKSFVADVAVKCFPIRHINTDEIARCHMMKGGASYLPVVEEFSKYSGDLVGEDGEINRKALSQIVLNDEKLLLKLNSITHPRVIDEIKEIIALEKKSDSNEAVLIETALIYESGIDKICDEVWYVYAPERTRRKRLREERGYSEEKIDGFFERQTSEEEFLMRADRIIPNGADICFDDLRNIISAYLHALEA